MRGHWLCTTALLLSTTWCGAVAERQMPLSDIDMDMITVQDKIPAHETTFNQIKYQGHAVATVKKEHELEQNNLLNNLATDDGGKTTSSATKNYKPPRRLKHLPPAPKHTSIPEYITRYAPAVHLYSEERYLPYDVASFVEHMALYDIERQPLDKRPQRLAIRDLQYYPNNRDIFMTAVDEFSGDPEWITGRYTSRPDIESGQISTSPATLVVEDRGGGQVDAYWFYFYSFNEGPYVMGTGPYGNHIGDWEHTLVRFQDEVPQTVWMSAHGGGSAYKFEAMEKLHTDQNRPIVFSARGTHANYASVGQHSHDLPFYILSDFTDRGPLWDPAQNYLAYVYDGLNVHYANGTIPGREEEYGNWLTFTGHWGDQRLLQSDKRQHYHPFEWRYIDGPTGPLDKNLGRQQVCQRAKWWNILHSCRVRNLVDRGEGIEAEGGNCARALDNIRPVPLQYLFRLLTWRGWGCFFVDRIWG